MAESRQLGAAYVQILSKGMDQVKNDLAVVKTGFNQSETAAAQFQRVANALNVKVMADTTNVDKAIAQTQAKLQRLQQARVTMTGDTSKVDQQIAQTQAKLQKQQGQRGQPQGKQQQPSGKQQESGPAPDSKVAAAAQGTQSAMQKMFSNLSGMVQKAVAQFQQLAVAINQAGAIAQRTFLAGSVAVAGFIRAADPAGVAKLQGTLAAIGVQLGSIFLPLLDKVQAGLDRVLSYLRSLTNEQKDQIVRWTQIAGSITLAVAVLPKVIGLITTAASAMQVLAAATGLASGGILPLLAVLAGVAAGFTVFETSAEKGQGILATLMETVKPLIETFKQFAKEMSTALTPLIKVLVDVGKVVLDVLGAAFKQIGPVVLDVVKTLATAISDLFVAAKPAIDALAGVFKTAVAIIADVLKALMPSFKELLQVVVEAFAGIMPVVKNVVEVIGEVLKTLGPILVPLVKMIAQATVMIVKAFSAMLAIVTPILEAMSAAMVDFGDIFAEIWGALTPLVEAFSEILTELQPLFDEVIAGIVAALKFLRPVFEAVFNSMRLVVLTLAKALVYVATLIKEISKGNIKGSVDAAKQAAEEMEERVNDKKKKRDSGKRSWFEDVMSGKFGKEEEKPKPKTKEKPGRHSGQLMQKVELIGIADLWRKAMQSTGETPEQKRLAEILATQQQELEASKAAVKLLEDIATKAKSEVIGFFSR